MDFERPKPEASGTHHTADDRNGPLEMDQLLQVLDRKRKELDRHIEQFKALKDQEFRAFEYWVKHRAKKDDIGEDYKVVAGRLRKIMVPQSQEMSPSGQLLAQSSPKSLLDDFEPMWVSGLEMNHDDIPKADPRFTEGFHGLDGSESTMQKTNGMKPHEDHLRDIEFQGVFTPAYLPLLNSHVESGEPQNAEIPSDNGNPISSKQSASPVIEKLFEKNAPGIYSSSAEGSRPTHLTALIRSSSCPDTHENSKHHRRSSSAGAKSDTSITSLRSSFKDPSTPRSPKRVMFDIDDMVVSPSTSPLVKKAKGSNSGPANGAVINGDDQSLERGRRAISINKDGEKFDIVKRKGSGRRTSSRNKTAKERAKNSMSPIQNGLTPNTGVPFEVTPRESSGVIAAAPSSANTSASSMPIPGFVDDFEKVSLTDDLFAFDEDMDLGGGGGGGGGDDDTNGKGGSALVTNPTLPQEEELEREPDVTPSLSVTGSSPHAGSLPIEIRWPGRRPDSG